MDFNEEEISFSLYYMELLNFFFEKEKMSKHYEKAKAVYLQNHDYSG